MNSKPSYKLTATYKSGRKEFTTYKTKKAYEEAKKELAAMPTVIMVEIGDKR